MAASFAGYLVGEFSNLAILSRLKIATHGRMLWTRTIASTIVGQGVDSAIFITVAFAGIFAWSDIVELLFTQWIVKVLYEVAATPITYAVVGFVKGREGFDIYDRVDDINPLSFVRKTDN